MHHYPMYPERSILDLNGFWEFAWLGDAAWDDVRPQGFRPQSAMAVPGVFDTLPKYPQKRGIGVIRRKLEDDFAVGDRLCLSIGGMGLFARLWFDGKPVGDCRLPYSTVDYDFVVERSGAHELLIALDNRFDPERVPLFRPNYDFYAYGGIYRDVLLQRLPSCAIDRVQITPLDLATGTVRLAVHLSGKVPHTCALTVAFDGKASQELQLRSREGRLETDLKVPQCRLWSPEHPHLHNVEVRIPGDCLRTRFGMRTVEARNGQILLNGEPVELRGFNRHEAHPQLGPVQTASTMLEDLQWLRSMNCNFVRCVHYPHDQAFFDLCDELGMLVWNEGLGWGNPAKQLEDPDFKALQEEQTRLMVRNGCNHPSIIIWAFINEGESHTEQALPLYRALAAAIRDEDSSRLVSYACNRGKAEHCLEVADVISLNAYPGWIGPIDWDTPSADAIAPYVDDLIAFFSGDSPLADMPLIFSEIGACGLYGCHDLARSQWTEEYQADYMVEAARAVLENPRSCGVALWQFCDTRSYGPSGQVRTKPRGMNNAGVLDEYRRPKLARAAVAEYFRTRATTHT